jgi:hypothetical protein
MDRYSPCTPQSKVPDWMIVSYDDDDDDDDDCISCFAIIIDTHLHVSMKPPCGQFINPENTNLVSS